MKPTILFADNERTVRHFCKQELEAVGFRVLLAVDGDEAIHVLDTFTADLVILDEHMPRCNGRVAARRIKQWHPDLPVILFTADPDYEGFEGPGVDATVSKSDDLSALKAAVITLLSQRTATEVSSDRGSASPTAGLALHA